MGQARRFERNRRFYWVFGPYSRLQTDSSCVCKDFWNANKIVGRCGEDEEPFDQASAAVAGLAQAPDGLHPTERLFDLFSLDHADAVASVTCGPRIDRRMAVGDILCHVRHAVALATTSDEPGIVISLIAP